MANTRVRPYGKQFDELIYGYIYYFCEKYIPMPYHPQHHNRRSIRLQGYDYSQSGLYFITICIQDKECLLGKIEDGKMILNDAGKMVEKWYSKIEEKFPPIRCQENIIMPNHFHCILEIVGADLRVCPNSTPNIDEPIIKGEHIGSPLQSISTIIQWFKTMTTNEYIRGVKMNNWYPFNRRLWQRNYYEHIIRSDESYYTIAEYIINNPERWQNDELFQS